MNILTSKNSIKESLVSCGLILLAALAVTLVMFGSYHYTYKTGLKAGQTAEANRWQAENERILRENQALQETVSSIKGKYSADALQSERLHTQEQTNYEQKYNDLLHNIELGRYRVYIPTAPVSSSSGTNSNNPASTITTTPATAQRCELDAATVSTLAALTRAGDTAILERNECIERYQQLEIRLHELNALSETRLRKEAP